MTINGSGILCRPRYGSACMARPASLEKKQLLPGQWIAMGYFGAIMVVSTLGAIESLRPVVDGKPLSMVITIQIFMLLAGALIILFTETDTTAIARNDVFRAGMVAVVAVFGVAWMANAVFEANLEDVKIALSGLVEAQPWTYAIALLLVSRLVNSQAAAITAMVPLALSIGVAPGYVIAFAAASYAYPAHLSKRWQPSSSTLRHHAYRQIPDR